MKLLFDQNLSRRLIARLADIYPASSHVAMADLNQASDENVWTYAKDNGYTIVTKDADFNDRCVLRGFPPKIIWLRLGNCSSARIESALRTRAAEIHDFLNNANIGVLAIC